MVKPLYLVLACLWAGTASAQSVARSIDLSALGWGPIEVFPIDTDRNPATEEWAVHSTNWFVTFGRDWRVVAVRSGGLCVGPWFDPRPAGETYAPERVELARFEGVDVLMVHAGDQRTARATLVRLETPACR